MPLYHLVGALDPIEESDIEHRLNDGLPETLPEWIRANGLTHIKIKLNGSDLAWDVDRVVRVDRVATAAQAARGATAWVYSLDFNERCPNVDYLLDFLDQIKQQTPAGFARIQYIEQPTARDLKCQPRQRHARGREAQAGGDRRIADRLREPDAGARDGLLGRGAEGVQGPDAGAAAWAPPCSITSCSCACRTSPARARRWSTRPGLAAHVKTVAAIEANSRQYVPAANAKWDKRYPGLFVIKDGTVDTSALTGPGLSLPDGPLT